MTGSLPSETFSLSLRVCESVFETIGKNWRERSRDLMERTIRDLVALQNEKERYLDSVQRRCFNSKLEDQQFTTLLILSFCTSVP